MNISYLELCELKKILKMTQRELLDFTLDELLSAGYEAITSTEDYVYTYGNIPVLLVAHLDTVHEQQPMTIHYNKEENQLSSPEGIGADDRAGVFAILEIVKRGLKPYVLFTTNEEDGCVGAKIFLEEVQCPDIHYIIEFDRRGSEDAVFYGCINQVFIDYILSHGFTLANGSSSDIRHLCERWDLAGVNLSIGFYNAHEKDEILKIDDMYSTINKTIALLEQPIDFRFGYK